MNKLKLCPFCGGEATITLFIKQIAISCTNCSAVVVEKTAQEAIEAWNRRVLNPTDIDNNMMDHPKKICEKCGRVVFWNSYFQDYICCCFVDDGVAEDESIEYK